MVVVDAVAGVVDDRGGKAQPPAHVAEGVVADRGQVAQGVTALGAIAVPVNFRMAPPEVAPAPTPAEEPAVEAAVQELAADDSEAGPVEADEPAADAA